MSDIKNHANNDEANQPQLTEDDFRMNGFSSLFWCPYSWLENTIRLIHDDPSFEEPESRQLVEQYETVRSPSLQQHLQYKHQKWGESELCNVDFDDADVHMDVSLNDAIKLFPISDSLAHCIQSYSTSFLSNHSSDSSSCCQTPTSASSSLPFSYFKSTIGDLAMPKKVQEAFDFAWSISRSINCPKRRSRCNTTSVNFSSPLEYSEESKPFDVCPRRACKTISAPPFSS